MPDNLVQDGDEQEVSQETLEGSGEVSQETLEQSSQDAEDLKSKYESELAKREDDIRKLKSSLQKQISEKENAWSEKEQNYKRELERAQLSSMDEDQRKAYEEKRAGEEIQNLYKTLEDLQSQNAQTQASLEAMSFFLDKGVPASELKLNDGYDALVQSGWGWIDSELKRLRSATSKPKQAANTKSGAPEVVTKTGAPPRKRTWDDLLKKYGSYEEVFSRVESGDLPASIIPIEE